MNRSKAEVRKLIRTRRKALSCEQQKVAAKGLLQQLQTHGFFRDSSKIALYLANDGEIDPIQVMQWCWKHGKKTYVPIIVPEQNNTLSFAGVTDSTIFAANRFGIREPVIDNNELLAAEDLDLVLCPLVAFDDAGNRVGMGGGYYDTTFEFLKNPGVTSPLLVGIAHEIQKVDTIYSENWDIPLAIVITDSNTYHLETEGLRG